MSQSKSLNGVEALIFDVFGTVVDWRRSVVDYLATLPQPTPPLNLESFAQEWRQGYYEATREFATSPNPNGFQTVDEIHLAILRTLIKKHNLEDLWTEPFLNDINLAWHRLHGWPDATEGLGLLKENYIIGTLSNGNARLLIDMAKFAGLPWDVIFSGDIMKAYKPNPRMYLGACEYLQLPPSRVAMVAAHMQDLKAAKSFGLKTIFVNRPAESLEPPTGKEEFVDLFAEDFVDVAHQLKSQTK